MLVVAGLIGLVLLLGLLPWPVYRDWAFVCENTGSHRGYRQWCVGWRSGEWHHESRLEQFLRRQHPSELKNQWTSYRGTGRNILGRPVLFGHGRPRLGTILMCRTVFDRYVDTLDDTAKLDLYRLLVSGNQEAIRACEETVGEMALEQGWPLR